MMSAPSISKTVSDIWLVAARTVFGWALKERLIQANPFVGVTVTVPKKQRLRETDAFTAEEARMILKASYYQHRQPLCRCMPVGAVALRLYRRPSWRDHAAARG
jgi:hypothetical protein